MGGVGTMIGTSASKRGWSGRGTHASKSGGVGCGGKEVANERCSLLQLAIFLKSRHFSNVVAVGFSASSREYQLDGINASKKFVSLINKNAIRLQTTTILMLL